MILAPSFLALFLVFGGTDGTGWKGHVCEDFSDKCALVTEYMALTGNTLCYIDDPDNPGQDYGYHCPLTCNRCVEDGTETRRDTLSNHV